MNLAFIMLQAAAQQSAMPTILMFVAIFVIMYFFMIRPQQKRQKEIQNFRNSITVGSQVVTAGGIYGIVKSIEADNTLIIEISRDVKVKIDRNSVYATAPVNDKA